MEDKKYVHSEYVTKYVKENYTRVEVKFKKEAEKDLLDYINSKGNRSDFIKECIRYYRENKK